MPPIRFPNGSKTVTEIEVGTRLSGVTAVSYTHLTLPTIYSV